MNRSKTKLLLSLCVAVSAASGASGGEVCIWTGGGTTDAWDDTGNWSSCDFDYPCTLTIDKARIAVAEGIPVLLNGVSCILNDLDVEALTADGGVTLEIDSGSLQSTTSGTVILAGDSNLELATITVDGGTFTPGTLTLTGGATGEGKATFKYINGTVTNDSDTITMGGLTKLDILADLNLSLKDVTVDNPGAVATEAEMDVASGKTLTLGDVTVDADLAATKLKKSGSGTLDLAGITLTPGTDASEAATLWLVDGEIILDDNQLALTGGEGAGKQATFDYDGGTFPATGHTDWDIFMRKYAKIDAEQDLNLVNGTLTVDAGFGTGVQTAVADIDMAVGKTFTAGSVSLTAGAAVNDSALLNATGLGDFASGAMTITGGTASGTTAAVHITADNFTTTGLVTIESGAVGSAELDVEMGTDATDVAYLDSVKMHGSANLEMSSDVAVAGQFEVLASGSDDPTLDLNDSVVVTLEMTSLKINGGVTFSPSFAAGSELVTR